MFFVDSPRDQVLAQIHQLNGTVPWMIFELTYFFALCALEQFLVTSVQQNNVKWELGPGPLINLSTRKISSISSMSQTHLVSE